MSIRFPAALVSAALLLGCAEKPINAKRALKSYQASASTRSSGGGAEIETFYCSPRFLALSKLRERESVSPELLDSLSAVYKDANYLALVVRPESGKDQIATGDLLTASLAGGRQAYASRLQLMQGGMAKAFYLELPTGEKVFPSAYTFDRGWGLRNDITMVFVFPKKIEGRAIPIFSSEIIMDEVGLRLGYHRHEIRKPSELDGGVL